ncbi:DUF3658 domain-containing protein [Lentilactobacillus kisonensis]|uniref:DUF1835 domain-containing protein n=3 Tax=Lentilactobacillus kisonensis TaxID=481722 RepID=A0A0R1NU70_9LACO|nr:DUF3658 domain-containing protein [Lentilactobacillus kisonensis]KRL23574.1 hypothetical protein FC98_GL000303 [Lentilactobacillus kisonensis DSM 19906 = JCM 15041]
MIDVLFNDSFAATLKYYYQQKNINNEVISLPMHLSLGDINQGNFLENRRTLYKIQSTHDKLTSTSECVRSLNESLERLSDLVNQDDLIRIWWSEASDDYCGFLWLCEWLAGKRIQSVEIHIPLSYVTVKGLRTFASLGEIFAEDIDNLALLDLQRPLTNPQRQAYGRAWMALRNDNTPVRANVNGHILSQPITFYDQFLISQISARRFRNVLRIIGETLGRFPVGVPDWWYQHRVEYLISKGVLDYKKDGQGIGSLELGSVRLKG